MVVPRANTLSPRREVRSAPRLPARGIRREKQVEGDIDSHASQHKTGGSDALTADGIGAAAVSHSHGQTRDLFIYPSQDAHDAILDDWPHNTAGSANEVAFIWRVAADWISINSINIVMIPDATETIQADIDVSVAAIGEDYNADTRQALDQTLAVVIDDITEWNIIDIDTLFDNIVAGDSVAIRFQSDTDTLRILGLRVNYTVSGGSSGGGGGGGGGVSSHPLLSNLDFASAGHTGFLAADGSVVGATSQAQGFGANGIKADVIAESTGAAGVTIDSILLKDGGFQAAGACYLVDQILYGSLSGGGSMRLKANNVDGTPASITLDDIMAFVAATRFEFNTDVVVFGTLSATIALTTSGPIIAGTSISGGTLSVTGIHVGPSGTWDSGGFDLAIGDSYAINGTDVLTATALGLAVVTSSLTTVGALASGSIVAGFGTIDGIAITNLLDKAATETVSGAYTFSAVLSVAEDIVLTGSTGNRQIRQASSYLQIDEDAAFVADVVIFSTNDTLQVPRNIRDPANIARINFVAGAETQIQGDLGATGTWVGEFVATRASTFLPTITSRNSSDGSINTEFRPGDTSGGAGRWVQGWGGPTVGIDVFLWRLAAKTLTLEADGLLIGQSVAAPSSTVEVAGSFGANITAISSNTTLDITHHVVACDASGGAFTVTLPAASGATRRIYHIKKIDSSGNAVTVDGNASETIDGDTTKVIVTQYDSMMIMCDGSNWHII